MKSTINCLKKAGFSMTCLDIGARWGFIDDLLPVAPIVNAIGFDPDKKECEKLNKSAVTSNPWKSIRYLPVALGTGENSVLHFYKQAGCSSLLEANRQLGELFSRGDYYILEGAEDVPVVPLDEAAKKYGFEKASFMKIDIQGAEMDVFLSGEKLLSESLVGLRVEVSFLPLYKKQPVFADVDSFLKSKGFNIMYFPEEHHWRRSTKIKYPSPSKGKHSFSRGQLAHSDALYLRMPEDMPNNSLDDKRRLLELAFIAMSYGLIDHAEAVLKKEGMREYAIENFKIDLSESLKEFSGELKRRTRGDLLKSVFSNLKLLVKSI